MSIFDCVNTAGSPSKPDQEVIDLGRKIDRILEEIKLFTQEAMSKFIASVEKVIAIQETVLNNSLQYIRNIIDAKTSSVSSVLTANRESVSNLVSQILTELIIRLNVNGLPVGTEQELSRPIIIENQVNTYGQTVNNYLESGQTSGGFASNPNAPIGGYVDNGEQTRFAGRATANGIGVDGNGKSDTSRQPLWDSQTSQDRGSNGKPENLIRSPETDDGSSEAICKSDAKVVVLFNGSKFYGSVLGSLANTLTPVIAITGPVTDVNVLNETRDLSSQVPAPAIPPLVQSPTGSLLPVGETFPVDLTSPLAWEFYGGQNVSWRRQAVRWLGGDAERLLFPASMEAGRQLLDSKLLDPKHGE